MIKKLERPNVKDYDFNDSIESVRYARDMGGYADELERQLDLQDSGDVFSWQEVLEFGRNAFYDGREIEKYYENGMASFKRPTYQGYLREIKNENGMD